MTDDADPLACPIGHRIIKAPWTDEQIDALCRWQNYGFVHEYTGPRDHGDGVQITMVLVPERNGWICPCCDYTQDWAHAFSFEPRTNSLDPLRMP